MAANRGIQRCQEILILILVTATCLEAFVSTDVIGRRNGAFSLRHVVLCFESTNEAEYKSPRILSSEQIDSIRSLPKCSVSFVEPETGCEVTLVGCFHGSPSSAQDVQETLTQYPPKVLVLELCPDRFLSIQEQLRKEDVATIPTKAPRRTETNTDWAVRSVGGILRLVNRVQSTVFSGLTPGLEFVTAIQSCPGTDIVLADQPVKETLRKLSRVPQFGLRSLRHGSPLRDSKGLGTALFGSKDHVSVNVFDFGMRHRSAQKELAQWVLVPMSALVLPILGLATISNDVLALSLEFPGNAEWNPSNFFPFVAVNVLMILLCYMGLVLPATRVVLHERDAILANGVLAACKVAKDESGDTDPPSRVTAILGLLHVNGVTRRLLNGEV